MSHPSLRKKVPKTKLFKKITILTRKKQRLLGNTIDIKHAQKWILSKYKGKLQKCFIINTAGPKYIWHTEDNHRKRTAQEEK